MAETLEGSALPLEKAYDTALLDLDGVAYRGPQGIPSAAPALRAARQAGMALVFVTNNASREPEEVARHLVELGIEAKPNEVLTAGQAAATMLTDRLTPGDAVLVVGGQALRTEVEAKGFRVVDSALDRPAAVVQGWHPDVGWKALAEASYAVRNGAYFLATGRDATLPNDRGIAPGNGTLVAAVVTASGIEPESAGKPEPRMFLLAAERASSRAPLVIGDRLDTDIAGASAAGIPALLVLTGVHSARDAILAPPGKRPSFIGETLSCLAKPHPAPVEMDGVWHVEDASAAVVRGELRLSGAPGLNAVRVACVAVWAAIDRGDAILVESVPELGIQ